MRAFAFALSLACIAGCSDTNTNVQRLPIGGQCATSGQCGTGKFYCDTSHINGVCRADCRSDGDCPGGSVCAGSGVLAKGACKKSCTTAGDCRAGEGDVCKLMPADASGPYCDAPPTGQDGGAGGDGGA